MSRLIISIYLQSSIATPGAPDEDFFTDGAFETRTERCTNGNGDWVGLAPYWEVTAGCAGQPDNVDIVASDGSDLCAGVDCGTGEISPVSQLVDKQGLSVPREQASATAASAPARMTTTPEPTAKATAPSTAGRPPTGPPAPTAPGSG